MKKRAIIAAMAVVAMVGCQKESDQVGVDISSTVSFSSTGIATTRTTEISDGDGGYLDAWEGNDRIGIFSSGYTSNGFTEEYANVEHAAICQEPSVSTDFEVLSDDNALLKPNSMSSDITYYAYYPYTSSVDEDGVITVDISKQDTESGGNLGDADFMVAATTISAPQDEVAFTFSHMLSKVQFKVSFDEEVTARDEEAVVSDLTAYVSSLPKAKYDRDGQFVEVDAIYPSGYYKMSSTVDGDQAIFTAILHPGAGMVFELEFCIGDQEYIVDISNLEFSAGMIHTYNVVLGDKEVRFTGESTINEWDGSSPSEDVDAESDSALASYWDGSVAINFNGVAYDYKNVKQYEIRNGRELALLAKLADEGIYTWGTTFTLTNDIHLSDQEWTPIGHNVSSWQFNGTFDGGGYTISGLNVDDKVGGLFFITESSTIKNLTIEGEITIKEITDENNGFGAIAASNWGTIENCCSNVTITNTGSAYKIAGIAGYNGNSGKITSCYNIGSINSISSRSGGIVGFNEGTIEACYNLGEVNGSTEIGGIVAANLGTIKSCYNRAYINGYQDVGGIVGRNYSTGTVTSVYNTAKVAASYIYQGGVIAHNYSTKITYAFTYTNGYDITADLCGYNDDVSIDADANFLATFSDPGMPITIDGTNHSLTTWLNMGGDGSSWDYDENSVNDGFPILTSINY